MVGHLLLLSSALEECTEWAKGARVDFMGVSAVRDGGGRSVADTVWGAGHGVEQFS
jgi:hypothetical protein